MPHAQLSSEDIELLKQFKKALGKTGLVKMNDQKLLTEMKEVGMVEDPLTWLFLQKITNKLIFFAD